MAAPLVVLPAQQVSEPATSATSGGGDPASGARIPGVAGNSLVERYLQAHPRYVCRNCTTGRRMARKPVGGLSWPKKVRSSSPAPESTANRDGNRACLRVRDPGPGVASVTGARQSIYEWSQEPGGQQGREHRAYASELGQRPPPDADALADEGSPAEVYAAAFRNGTGAGTDPVEHPAPAPRPLAGHWAERTQDR